MYQSRWFNRFCIGSVVSRSVAWLLLIVCSVTGCANPSSVSQSGSTEDVQLLESEPQANALTGEFNEVLGKIENHDTATKAVDMFVAYMADRFQESAVSTNVQEDLGVQSISTQSNRDFFVSLMDRDTLVDLELTARTKGISAQSNGQGVGISLGAFVEQLNAAQESVQVTEKELATIRDGLRRLIPNISSDSTSPLVTPLESMVISWAFLTVGITLGSWWAYYELGWGGWWFWDPVENASFMPWLVATALIHSLSVSEKRGAFRQWTVLLAIGGFSLSLLGTFLVRSGVLTSVHAFATKGDLDDSVEELESLLEEKMDDLIESNITVI